MAEANLNPNDAQTFDAQRIAEDVAAGEKKLPKVDVSADYEASKEFSVSDVDRSSQGEEAAKAATAPKFQVPAASESQLKTDSTGNPDDYRSMAKDVRPDVGEAGAVSDDLVRKAIEKGTPA